MSKRQPSSFHVALTHDFYDEQGQPKFADLGLGVFDPHPHINVSNFSKHEPVIAAEQLAGVNGVIVLTPQVTQETLAESEDLLAIGRFGVGYDTVDVEACTQANVLAMITAGAVDRPVAEATIMWMLALTHHLGVKDRLVRTGRWDDRSQWMGCELRDRTFGAVGLGGIAMKTVEMLKGFGMNAPLAFDPYIDPKIAKEKGIKLVELNKLVQQADFVSLHCPLTESTRGLIGAEQIGMMKPIAYLINTARGGIVDEDALYDALKEKRIAGAALDCFVGEPITEPHRFGDLDNVLLAPHAIAWTNELFRDIGQTACQAMVDLSEGRRPAGGVLNPELFENDLFREKWARLIGLADPQALTC